MVLLLNLWTYDEILFVGSLNILWILFLVYSNNVLIGYLEQNGEEQNAEELNAEELNAEEQNGEEESQEEAVVVDADSTDGAVLVNGNEAEQEWGTNNEGTPSA